MFNKVFTFEKNRRKLLIDVDRKILDEAPKWIIKNVVRIIKNSYFNDPRFRMVNELFVNVVEVEPRSSLDKKIMRMRIMNPEGEATVKHDNIFIYLDAILVNFLLSYGVNFEDLNRNQKLREFFVEKVKKVFLHEVWHIYHNKISNFRKIEEDYFKRMEKILEKYKKVLLELKKKEIRGKGLKVFIDRTYDIISTVREFLSTFVFSVYVEGIATFVGNYLKKNFSTFIDMMGYNILGIREAKRINSAFDEILKRIRKLIEEIKEMKKASLFKQPSIERQFVEDYKKTEELVEKFYDLLVRVSYIMGEIIVGILFEHYSLKEILKMKPMEMIRKYNKVLGFVKPMFSINGNGELDYNRCLKELSKAYHLLREI